MSSNNPFAFTVPTYATFGLTDAITAVRDALAAEATGPHSQNAFAGAQSLAEVVVKLQQIGA